MKLQDPTAPFADVIGRRRRERAATNAQYFRLGGRAPGARTRASAGPVAVLGASGWALREEHVERTAAYLGALGGLLADFGYDVFAITSVPDLDAAPAFVAWVGGEETPAELAQLVALDARGLSLSPGAVPVDSWTRIEPEGQPTSIKFIRTAFDEIRHLTESVGLSTTATSDAGSSTGRAETARDAGVQDDTPPPRNPSSAVPDGTQRDGLGRRRSNS